MIARIRECALHPVNQHGATKEEARLMHCLRRERDDPGVRPSLPRGPAVLVPKMIGVRRKDDPIARRGEAQLRIVGNIPLTVLLSGLDTNAPRLKERDDVMVYAFIQIDDATRHHASW